MKSSLRCVEGKIIVKLLDAEEKQSGVIYIPESGKEQPILRGKIVSLGFTVIQMNIDNEIYFSKYTSSKIEHNNEIYYVLNTKDVLAIIV